ncbi:MAG: Gfo/Idh/MocA family protein [Ignavibacteriales bacterium]
MKVLIVGLGSIGKKHLKAIRTIDPQCEIFALRSGRGCSMVEDVKNIYSLDEIKSDPVSFAIISNPTSEHKNTLQSLLSLECPLFIEKPLHSSLDIDNFIDIVEKKKITTYVACNLRFLDSLTYVKKTFESENKRLNEVNVYCGSYLPDWRPGTAFKETYSARPELGGGVHIDLIHEIDYLYWLFGMPLNVRRTFKKQSSLQIQAYDYANYLLEYEGFCANTVLNYFRRDTKRTLELVFEGETWHIDLLKNQISVNENIIYKSEQKIADTYLTQMEYFLNNFKKENFTFNTVSDAFNVLKICLEK